MAAQMTLIRRSRATSLCQTAYINPSLGGGLKSGKVEKTRMTSHMQRSIVGFRNSGQAFNLRRCLQNLRRRIGELFHPSWQDSNSEPLAEDLNRMVQVCVRERRNTMKIWDELFMSAKTIAKYISVAYVGFFYLTHKGESTIFASIGMLVVVGIAALLLLGFNRDKLRLARRASFIYRNGTFQKVFEGSKLGNGNAEIPQEVKELALPLQASDWSYLMFCWVLLLVAFIVSIWQMIDMESHLMCPPRG